jgi:tetratricopeptide (TPR) repeat protein
MPIANQQKVWLLPVVAMLLMVFPALGYAQSTPGTKNVDHRLSEEIAKSESEARARPNDLNLLYQLATLYHQDGDYAKSVPLLQRLASAQPDNSDIQFLLGLDLYYAGQPAKAVAALKIALRANPLDSQTNFYLGLCYLALDRNEEAKQAFAVMAANAPSDVDHLYYLMKAYTGVSSALLARLTDMGKDSYRMQEAKGEYFDMQNDPAAAIREYEKAVQMRPDLPTLHFVLGNAYWKHSQLDEAIAEFRKTIALSSTHFMAHYNLGLVLLEKNDAVDAIPEFRAALAIQPGLVGAYLALGKAFFRNGDYDAAVPQIQRGLELVPDNPEGHYFLAQIYSKQHKSEDAKRELAIFEEQDRKAKAAEVGQGKAAGDLP